MTPQQRWTLERLGHLLYTRGRYDQAAPVFDGLAQLFPDRHYPWYALGMIAQKKGNEALACDYLRHALQLAPADAPTRLALAELELRRGDKQAALTALRGIERSPPCAQKKRALVLRKRWFGA